MALSPNNGRIVVASSSATPALTAEMSPAVYSSEGCAVVVTASFVPRGVVDGASPPPLG